MNIIWYIIPIYTRRVLSSYNFHKVLLKGFGPAEGAQTN